MIYAIIYNYLTVGFMKFFKRFAQIVVITLLIISSLKIKYTYAADADFIIDTSTNVLYTTGDDFVTVITEYVRSVENSSYYFPATGEKLFHIPDISSSKTEEIDLEREYKLGSLTVTDANKNKVSYSVEEKEGGEGIFVSIPNYKTTTPSSAYKIFLTYKTHDYIQKVGNFVNIIGTSLPEDTTFDRKDEENGTLTIFNYNFSIVTDSNLAPLSKAFPAFTIEEKDEQKTYIFKQTDRIGNSPYLEFGTSVVYKFELEYKTPKTDSFIPEKYSNVFKALSTNIYELSLPREFSETKQRIYFEDVSPTPTDIYKDTEGNILALFEVPANQESTILIKGYILVNQDEWSEEKESFDMELSKYLEDINSSEYINKYLGPTKYWQANDQLIVEKAETLKKDQETLLDVIKANYRYIGETLEYDEIKATSENERIGAKEAILGGPSVCMEYADVMISLLRAQGIPSRAAIGYANLQQQEINDQVRHQWVQIWVPGYGWLSVDPTFESNNMKIGQMMDRVLWETFNTDSLSNIRVYSANDTKKLTSEGYDIKIYGASNEIDLNGMKSYADLLQRDEISELSPNVKIFGSTILKTTTVGKALIITVPILIVLTLIVLLISIVNLTIKKIKKKKKNTI